MDSPSTSKETIVDDDEISEDEHVTPLNEPTSLNTPESRNKKQKNYPISTQFARSTKKSTYANTL